MAAEVTLDLEGWNDFKAQHLESRSRAPMLVENQVIQWIAELMRLPSQSSGILLGSAELANFLGLAVARYASCGFDVRKYGLYGGTRRLTVYGTSETRVWGQKGLELLGLGSQSWRDITMRDFRMDTTRLRQQIATDRRGGFQPLCVIGTAGAAGTGASDDLNEIAQIASEAGIWLHVDGAFGALAQWSERLRGRVAGIERADSVAFDLQKWSHQPFAIACLLVRDGETHRNACATGLPFVDLGVEPGRELRAFEVWMSLKAHGARLITSVMEQNVDQALHLASLVSAHSQLELLASIELNIVCFRYVPRGCGNLPLLNALNEELLLRLQEQGNRALSGSVFDGRFCLRCTFASRRARPEDTSELAAQVARLGAQLARERLP
jgi:glutamate/tyrosine decarboxylase-like PLP-dependent enzyme